MKADDINLYYTATTRELARCTLDREILRVELESYDLGLTVAERRRRVAKERNAALLKDIESFQAKMRARLLACPLKERRMDMQRKYYQQSVEPNIKQWLDNCEQ